MPVTDEKSCCFNVKRGSFRPVGLRFKTPKTLVEARVAYRQHLVADYLRTYSEFISTEAEIRPSELSFRLSMTDKYNMILTRVTDLG